MCRGRLHMKDLYTFCLVLCAPKMALKNSLFKKQINGMFCESLAIPKFK